ncbi:WD40-repeat-containing domain protein [Dimargaris cristalligena]|uniref:WD40-repeat-containing domain protein n=1 Tax=Dimargaris cristalligena TaxID=215637 RepID=A0A4V1J541_9FUNG|nr:WD40-repeat-containing domain protein [Dimargaris cristalligena]|eukprot:RKP37739.1 WD40-repeat-containing domain protein [Dimargaris cristalligena]
MQKRALSSTPGAGPAGSGASGEKSGEPASATTGNVDRIVLQYLQSKGYSKAAASLASEAPVQSLVELADQFQPNEDVSVPNYILFYNDAEQGNPDIYRSSYGQLRNWIERSLELYQPELLTISYPIFVHAYLDLVTKQLPDHARTFWAQFHGDHVWTHPDEISQLALIVEPTHVRENTLAQTFMQTKYNIRMSKVAFELLMSFLQENKLMLLLRIINQYLNIKVDDQVTTGAGDADRTSDIGLVGVTNGQLAQFNQERLTLGHRSVDPELRTEVEQTLKDIQNRQPDAPEMDVDTPMVGTLLQDLQKIKKEPLTDAPGLQDVPFPPHKTFDVKEQLRQLADVRKTVSLSREALPSICCYTFHNTYDSLNCTTVSDDLTLLAGGFSESYIKLWSLTDEPLRGLRSNFNPSHVADMDDLNRYRERTDQRYRKLVGHSGPVYGVSLSPDAQYLVSCSEDKTARLWSLDTFTNLVCYRGHNYPIWDVEFGPYGVYFATAAHDRTARLWSCEHIYPLRIFAGHLADVDCVKFHPNSKYLVTGSTDRTCRLWDLQRGTCVRVFTGHQGPITAVAVAPNGRTMASASEDRTITLWDLGSGRQIQRVVGHEKSIYSLAFSQESTLLMSGGADCTVRLWDVSSEALSAVNNPSFPPAATTAGSTPSTNLLSTFPTKRTPVYNVHYTRRNLGIAIGAFQPQE